MGFEGFGEELGKLKQLHEDDTRPQLGRGGDPVAWIEIYDQNLEVENHDIFIGSANPSGSWLIWSHTGSPLYGLWDVGSWAGSSTFSGSPYFDYARIIEQRIHQYFVDDFTSTTYKDAGVTTAQWTGNGSIVFIPSGSVAQSNKVLGSDVRLQTTLINRITMDINGSNTAILSGYVSSNAGTTFHPVSFGEETTLTSGLGSDIRWKLSSDSSGSAKVGSVFIIIKSSDW